MPILSLLHAHNANFCYDIISLCETSLTDNIHIPEELFPNYKYIPCNSPSGKKQGGVGIFYKATLPLKVRSDLSFDRCLVVELVFMVFIFTSFHNNSRLKDKLGENWGKKVNNGQNMHKFQMLKNNHQEIPEWVYNINGFVQSLRA